MPYTSGKPIRLRDFIRVGNFYFSVVGYKNSESVRSLLRYAPDKKGDRVRSGIAYKKLSYEEAIEIGEKWFRREEGIFRVPLEEVDEVFKPEERLSEVIDSEVKKVVEFFEGIPRTEMGVTGSRLIGLKKEGESDVDFVVYGKYWFDAREKIRRGIERKRIEEPDEDTWERIYKKRNPPLTYEAFLLHERRKYHRAFIGSTYFDLLYVRGYDELDKGFPEKVGRKIRFERVTCRVTDDSLAFDYPSVYYVNHEEIEAVVSFTHTFAGQAFRGEVIEAAGWIEEIDGRRYLIAGSRREVKDEYIVSLTLLEKEGVRNFLTF